MVSVDINKKLGDFNISIKFLANRTRCVIFGESGSGKSSLLKMIAGFYNPDAGEIKVNSKLFFSSKKKISMPIQKRNVGYLPQEYTLFPNMTVRENIAYGVRKKRITDGPKLETVAEKFGISGCLERYPSEISGGQKQRAALARAIMVKPDILLLDEPFSALDRPIREELRELVIDIAETMHIPVLFVTHDLEEAFIFAGEIVIIKNGISLEYGDRDAIFNGPSFVETARLLGFSNIWKVKRIHNGAVELENGLFLKCNTPDKSASFCCIRPENIMILRRDRDISDKENRIDVTVERINFRGKYINLTSITKNGVRININIPPHILEKMSIKRHSSITVSLKQESIILCREAIK